MESKENILKYLKEQASLVKGGNKGFAIWG
jgi:hypothetical protein